VSCLSVTGSPLSKKFVDGKAVYGAANVDEKDIVIDDVSPAAFKKMLQCSYVSDCDITAGDVTELVALAKRFQVDCLKALCVDYMERDVTAEKACTLFVEGRQLLNEPSFGLAFIEENFEDIIGTDGNTHARTHAHARRRCCITSHVGASLSR
jgi:hypothetical protein